MNHLATDTIVRRATVHDARTVHTMLLELAELIDADAAVSLARRVHEFTASDIHPDVRYTVACGMEEDQVSRFHALMINLLPGIVLLSRSPWQRYSLSPIDILREAGAVESSGPGGAPSIRRAPVRERGPNDVVGGGGRFGLRPYSVRIAAAALVPY